MPNNPRRSIEGRTEGRKEGKKERKKERSCRPCDSTGSGRSSLTLAGRSGKIKRRPCAQTFIHLSMQSGNPTSSQHAHFLSASLPLFHDKRLPCSRSFLSGPECTTHALEAVSLVCTSRMTQTDLYSHRKGDVAGMHQMPARTATCGREGGDRVMDRQSGDMEDVCIRASRRNGGTRARTRPGSAA